MAITFTATGSYDKLKKFLGTECGDYFTAVREEYDSSVSARPYTLKLYTVENAIKVTDHAPDNWETTYTDYYELDSETGVYTNVATQSPAPSWVADRYYEELHHPFIVASFGGTSPTVLKYLQIISKDDDSEYIQVVNSTSNLINKLGFLAKCGGGIFLGITADTLLTNPAAKGACIIITHNNSGDTTAICSVISTATGTSSYPTRLNTFTTGVRCIAVTDQFEMINTFAYTRQYGEQWQFVPFITVGDGTNASYTPHAYYAQCVEYGFDTNFSRIVDKEGYSYMTNGYWAVKDITEDDNQTDEETE